MRFHVIGMAHTMTTSKYAHCAYTMKIINFCKMMMKLGHEVYLYAGEKNEAPCTQHFVCITEKEQKRYVKGHYLDVEHKPTVPHWSMFNGRAAAYVSENARIGDFLCIIFGYCQKPISDACKTPKVVEYGVGYHHTFADHRFFESYAWMHMVYAAEKGSDRDGIFYDDVIPGYYDPELFPAPTKAPKDYLLYMGRMINRKGLPICQELAKATGRQLITAGHGDPPAGSTYMGEVGPQKRAELIGAAHAVLCPSIYVEPFGNIAIEAMAMGTPVITTDWGAYTETVQHGVTGFRCRILREFVAAVEKAGELDRKLIRAYAKDNYSLDAIAPRYERAFQRLQTLWGVGWGALDEATALKKVSKVKRKKAA